jgi:hypothetical protein
MTKRAKRIIFLSIGIVTIGVLGFFTLRLLNPAEEVPFDAMSFAIEDTNSIDKNERT